MKKLKTKEQYLKKKKVKLNQRKISYVDVQVYHIKT